MDIIAMAREMGKAIQKAPMYTNYHKAKDAADADATLQDLIGKFNLKKLDLQNEIQSQGRSSERMKELDSELKELYETIMQNPNMQAYNDAKAELDDLLSFVNQIIVNSTNGQDPDTIQKESAEGCGGSCSSCSGCN